MLGTHVVDLAKHMLEIWYREKEVEDFMEIHRRHFLELNEKIRSL